MSIRLASKVRPAVLRQRAELRGRELLLFDFLCAAGQLGYRMPDDDIKLQAGRGSKDPRRRLTREFSKLLQAPRRIESRLWSRAADQLVRRLAARLKGGDISSEDRPLRVLLAYVTIALAPDCKVPEDPFLRVAWNACGKLFKELFPSEVRLLGSLDCVQKKLAALRRETAAGLRIGRMASGQKPGPAGKSLAVDPDLIGRVGKALGKPMAPGYMARFLFYARPGDHIWPHPDDPKFAVTVLVCVRHDLPRNGVERSAFVAYPVGRAPKRFHIPPGSALALEPGMIHAREPVQSGERVVLLSIGLVRRKRRGGKSSS